MQILQFLKLCWMFGWRLFLLHFLTRAGLNFGFALFLAVGAAAITVFGFNKTIITWPIIRGLFRKETVFVQASVNGEGMFTRTPGKRKASTPKMVPDAVVPREIEQHLASLDSREVIQRATRKGIVTGYEPKALRGVPVPRDRFMVGTPGGQLHSATNLGEAEVAAGALGEENFAKVLAITGLLDRFQTIWSVPVPDAQHLRVADYNADIDCIIPTMQGLVLVDLKLYTSGAVKYYSAKNMLYVEDVETGQLVGEPVPLSTNMRNATQNIRNHFPDVAVLPVVVLMPTDRGQGELVHVFWPGAVPAQSISDFLYWLSTQWPATVDSPVQMAANRLAQLRQL